MAQEKREEIIRLVLTKKEKAELKTAADRASMPVAVYVRVAALAAARAASSPA